MKKLHNLQIVSGLTVTEPLTAIALPMRNFMADFIRILESVGISPEIVNVWL